MKKQIMILALIAICILLGAIDNWEMKYYVDEFGDNTDTKYLSYMVSGTFSNDVTINSQALYHLTYSMGRFGLDIFEYNKYKVTSYSDVFVPISFKKDDGTKKVIKRGLFISDSGCLLTKESGEYVKNNLIQGQLRVSFRNDGEKYLFTIKHESFEELLNNCTD